jgi:prophage regulatory protein
LKYAEINTPVFIGVFLTITVIDAMSSGHRPRYAALLRDVRMSRDSNFTPPRRFLRLPAVKEMTGLGRATIYELIERGEFPGQVKIGRRAAAWLADEIAAWQAARISERDAKPRGAL